MSDAVGMREWITLKEAARSSPVRYETLLERARKGNLGGSWQMVIDTGKGPRLSWVMHPEDVKHIRPAYADRPATNLKDAKGFGKIVRALRRKLGFTQGEVSELVGVTREQWSNWERARWMPRAYDVARLVALAGVTPSEELAIWRAFAEEWLRHDEGRTKRKYRKEWL